MLTSDQTAGGVILTPLRQNRAKSNTQKLESYPRSVNDVDTELNYVFQGTDVKIGNEVVHEEFQGSSSNNFDLPSLDDEVRSISSPFSVSDQLPDLDFKHQSRCTKDVASATKDLKTLYESIDTSNRQSTRRPYGPSWRIMKKFVVHFVDQIFQGIPTSKSKFWIILSKHMPTA